MRTPVDDRLDLLDESSALDDSQTWLNIGALHNATQTSAIGVEMCYNARTQMVQAVSATQTPSSHLLICTTNSAPFKLPTVKWQTQLSRTKPITRMSKKVQ